MTQIMGPNQINQAFLHNAQSTAPINDYIDHYSNARPGPTLAERQYTPPTYLSHLRGQDRDDDINPLFRI